jgi:hypothetical protein
MGGSGPVGFDLDMTLINSRPAILASFAETSRETGTAIDLDAVDRRLGVKLTMSSRSGSRRTGSPRRRRSTGGTTCGWRSR